MNFKNLMKLVSIVVLVVSITACENKPSKTVNESIEALPLDSIKPIYTTLLKRTLDNQKMVKKLMITTIKKTV